MACEKLSLSAIPSKSEKHAPARHMDGLSDRDCQVALNHWEAHIGRLRILVERSEEFSPPVFVKNVDESMPELRRAAMAVVMCNQVLNGENGGI
jgi:hypothetical protein